ncbi:MAG: PaaI family thioesterase [Ardenticatenaceae bacterium]
MSKTTERTRVITWDDPTIGAKAAPTMSGLEYFEAMLDGTLPRPAIGALMNFDVTEASEGRIVFSVEPAEYHYNPIGTVHGGLAATLLDSAMGCAVHTVLPAGVGYTTIELKVNYIRALTVNSGLVHAIGEVIHCGRRVATAEGKIVDENGKLYAHGTTTCLIFQPK